MKVALKNIAITHIAAALPKQKISVWDYEDGEHFKREDIEKISKSTGITAVHVSDDALCASDYMVMMAERLMKENGWTGEDFDGIIFVSQTPDYLLPATSVRMQDRLGLPKTAVAFDINYGCSGFVYGIYQASLLVSSGSCRRVLLCNGDTKLRMVHEHDRTARMVLGDGFAVSVIEPGNKEMGFNLHSDGSGYRYVIYEANGFRKEHIENTTVQRGGIAEKHWPDSYFMDGLAIMKFALANVPPLVRESLEFAGWSVDEVGTFAMHQVNQMILGFIARNLKIPMERMPLAMQETGNTGSASVPLMLSVKHKELEEKGMLAKTFMCGFGVGLSWGAVTADLSETKIYDTWEF